MSSHVILRFEENEKNAGGLLELLASIYEIWKKSRGFDGAYYSTLISVHICKFTQINFPKKQIKLIW